MDYDRQFYYNDRAVIDGLNRAVERALQPYCDALDSFLEELFRGRLPYGWRRRWQFFVSDQAALGYITEPKSVREMEEWIEDWARLCGLLPLEEEDEEFELDTESAQPFLITVVPDKSGPHLAGGDSGDGPPRRDAVFVNGVEVAGPGPDTTDSFKVKVREALRFLNPRVERWWSAVTVQGQVQSRAFWPWQKPYYSKLGANDQPFIFVDEDMTAGETAQAIVAEVETGWFANSIGVYYRKYKFAQSGDWREFKAWQEGAAKDAARLASVLAEMYVTSVASINPAGELVVTVNDVAENGPQWNQLLSILPYVGHLAVVSIVVQVGKRRIKLPKKVAELWGQLKSGKQKRLLTEAAGAKTDAEAVSIIERGAKDILGDEHHIATNKNWISSLEGGPWSPRFERLFKRVGMTLRDVENRVRIPRHRGPHPEEYHQEIFDRLSDAIVGKKGDDARNAMKAELQNIAAEAIKPGTKLNRLLAP